MPRLSPIASYAINLSHPNLVIRARSAAALGEYGAEAFDVAPVLLVIQRFDPDQSVREHATRALYRIDPQQLCLEQRLPDDAQR